MCCDRQILRRTDSALGASGLARNETDMAYRKEKITDTDILLGYSGLNLSKDENLTCKYRRRRLFIKTEGQNASPDENAILSRPRLICSLSQN